MQSFALANGTKGQTDWNAINWRKANRFVKNLRQRIFRATTERNYKKVRSLQKLMLRSFANILTSVRRVTQQNAGRNTPGIDKVVVKTPTTRGKLVDELSTFTQWKSKTCASGVHTEIKRKATSTGNPCCQRQMPSSNGQEFT